jgi:peptide deformylase
VADQQQNSSERPEDDERFDEEFHRRRALAMRFIRTWGDPVLKTTALRVERFDSALAQQVEQMGRLMADAYGVGLAATQLGQLNRVLVYRVEPDSPIIAVVNPEIEWRGSEQETMEEGCLSLPGIHVDVERPVHVRARAYDERGRPFVVEASGLEARVLQHEVDHLDGVLMLDRASRSDRREAIRALREAERERERERVA